MKKVVTLLCAVALTFCFAVFGQAGAGAEVFAENGVDISQLTNVALNKPVTAEKDGYVSTTWNKTFLTDGNKLLNDATDEDGNYLSNGWFLDGSASTSEETWFYVDLEENHTVSAVAVYPRGNGKYFPVNYEIQLSQDAQSWTTVKSVEGDTGAIDVDRVWAITPTEARYVRMLITERYNEHVSLAGYESGYIVQVSEIEVYEGEIATEPPATTKPQDTNVKTGDSGVTVLTFAVILLSAAAVILFTANRKRSCR